jgi:hypothetical protein
MIKCLTLLLILSGSNSFATVESFGEAIKCSLKKDSLACSNGKIYKLTKEPGTELERVYDSLNRENKPSDYPRLRDTTLRNVTRGLSR